MPINRVLRPQAYAAADSRPRERLAGYAPRALIVPGRGTVHFTETTYGDDGGLNALAEENAESFVFSNRFQIIDLGSLCRVADLDSHTVVVSCRLDSFPHAYPIPVGYTDTAGSNRQSFIYSTGGSYTDISFGRNGAGATPRRVALTQFGPVLGTRHNFAVRKTGGTTTFFVNGQAVTPSSAGAVGGATGNAALGQIAAGNNSYGFIGQVYAFALFDGLLPDALLEEISADPIRALFEPRRMWVPVSVTATDTDLVVADSTHDHTADPVTLGVTTSTELVVQDAAHEHSADPVTLAATTTTLLAPDDTTHAHAPETVALTTASTLSVNDSGHGHGHEADSVTLAAAVSLSVDDATHTQTADPVTLGTTGAAALDVQGATHRHTAEPSALTVAAALAVEDAAHAHTAQVTALASATALSVADATHGHAAENVALDTTGATILAPADASHAQTADGVGLTVAAGLSVDDSRHAHTAEGAALGAEFALDVHNASHGHTAQNAEATTGLLLAVDDAEHAHAADAVTLYVEGVLAGMNAAHGHTAAQITFTIPGVATYPAPSQVLAGVVYGPNGNDYVGTLVCSDDGTHIVEGTHTRDGMLRLILAAVSGKTNGAGTATEEFASVDGAKVRIRTTFDTSCNRETVYLDSAP